MEPQQSKANEFKILQESVADGLLSLRVQVEAEVVNKAYRKIQKLLLRQVRVPGFRPGKIPLPILSQVVGKENFAREVRKEILPHFYYDAMAATSYRPLGEVTYDESDLNIGSAFEFTAKVPVSPKVSLTDVNSLKVGKTAPKPVEDDKVEAVLKDLQRRNAKLMKAEDETVKDGDYVLSSFTVTIDGREYKTLGQNNVPLWIGEDKFLPGFDENLVGKKKDEEFTFALELPKKDLDNKSLLGKKALIKGKVKTVSRPQLPLLDDEFAKDLGSFESLAELRKRIVSDIEKKHERDAEEQFIEDLRKKLTDTVDVNLPAPLIDSRIGDRLEEFKSSFQTKPYTYEDSLAETGRTEETVATEIREQVTRDLKLKCALDEMASQEGIEVSDQEFETRVKALSQAFRREPEQILETLDSGGRRILERQEIRREKAFERLVDRLK